MKIVTEEAAPVTKVRRSVPPNVAAAVSKALEKLAADRFGAAKEFADALTNPAFTLPTTQVATVAGAPASGPWKRVAIATTALAAVFVLTTLGGWLRPEPAKPVSRYGMTLPNALFEATNLPRLALSPDGARLVYVGSDDGMTDQLLMRTRDELTAVPLPGTEDARAPFFSPDGSQVGFLIPPGVLKVVSLAWRSQGRVPCRRPANYRAGFSPRLSRCVLGGA
jgi:serine/threonine-protein kinase